MIWRPEKELEEVLDNSGKGLRFDPTWISCIGAPVQLFQHCLLALSSKNSEFKTWKTVRRALRTVSKLEVGVSVGKLNDPPKSCIPSSAKMKMNKKRRKRRDMMDDSAFIRAITRLRSGDQYLKRKTKGSFSQETWQLVASGVNIIRVILSCCIILLHFKVVLLDNRLLLCVNLLNQDVSVSTRKWN